MTDPLAQLDADIERLKKGDAPLKHSSQAGYAFRVGTELVSGVAVGFGIGYGLDAWLDTRPWMTLLWSILGFAAGMKLMIDTSKRAALALEAEDASNQR